MVEAADILVAEASFSIHRLRDRASNSRTLKTPTILCYHDFGINRASPIDYENPDKTRHALQIGEGYISLMALGFQALSTFFPKSWSRGSWRFQVFCYLKLDPKPMDGKLASATRMSAASTICLSTSSRDVHDLRRGRPRAADRCP